MFISIFNLSNDNDDDDDDDDDDVTNRLQEENDDANNFNININNTNDNNSNGNTNNKNQEDEHNGIIDNENETIVHDLKTTDEIIDYPSGSDSAAFVDIMDLAGAYNDDMFTTDIIMGEEGDDIQYQHTAT
jgi:hypothetical protein